MRKLIIAVVTALVFATGAYAAVNCDKLVPCKYTGTVGNCNRSGTECPSIVALVDQSGRLNASLDLSDGFACQNLSGDRADVSWDIPQAGGWILILLLGEGVPPDIQYSLDWLFEGCNSSTCGDYTTGNPAPNCESLGAADLPVAVATIK